LHKVVAKGGDKEGLLLPFGWRVTGRGKGKGTPFGQESKQKKRKRYQVTGGKRGDVPPSPGTKKQQNGKRYNNKGGKEEASCFGKEMEGNIHMVCY